MNGNVREISRGLRGDVDRLDRTVTRDLTRFEAGNREDLAQFEQRTAAALGELERNIDKAVAAATAGARDDLSVLEGQIREDRALEATLRETDSRVSASIASLETRLTRLEKDVGFAP